MSHLPHPPSFPPALAPQPLPVAARRTATLLLGLSLVSAVLAVLVVQMLSVARAYVAGEGQWSRAQKSAVLALHQFLDSGDAAHWAEWRAAIAVPLGDRRAREALDRRPPDFTAATEGLLAGRNHPDDLPGVMRLYRCCNRLPYMADAVAAWREADGLISELVALADRVDPARGPVGAAERAALQVQVLALDARLTPLEVRFSESLGAASRLLAMALAVLLAGGTTLAGLAGWTLVRRQARQDALAAAALGRSEALFRSLWETTDDTVLIVGTDDRIRFANPAADRLFGHPAGTLPGQPLAMLMPERMRAGHAAGMQRHLATGQRRLDWSGVRIPGLHADGREIPIEIRFARLELPGDTLFVGFLRDITQALAAEQAVQQAQAVLEQRVEDRTRELRDANRRLQELDRLKSEFMTSVSHELRTPLNGILGFAGLLMRERAGPLTAEQRRQLGFILTSGEQLRALITDVLDLTQIESGRMTLRHERFDLAELVAEVVGQLRPQAELKGLTIHQDGLASLPLLGDRRKAMQVLLSVAGNAVKFTERGGVRLVVSTAGEDAGAPACVAVHDTGMGISAEQLPQLFQAFRQLQGGLTRPHGGTGLGLHLTRRLLDLMGGDIAAESRPGEGSVFRIQLPRAARPAPD